MNQLSALLVVLAPLAAPSSAQSVVLLSQDRFIRGEGEVIGIFQSPNDLVEFHAPDFGPFEASALGLVNFDGAEGRGYSDQRSTVTASGIHGRGATHVQASSSSDSEGHGIGRSHLEVEFQVTAPVSFSACGSLSTSDDAYSSVYLRRGNEYVFDLEANPPSQHTNVSESGVLQPGVYVFRVYSQGYALQSYGSATFDVLLSFEPLIETYCVTTPNSFGNGALIGYVGGNSAFADDFTLTVADVPQFSAGIFFYGDTRVQLPFGDGVRCVGGNLFRLPPPLFADAFGSASRVVDLGSGTPFLSGTRWNFQYWYRDVQGGVAGFNVSDALSVGFCE